MEAILRASVSLDGKLLTASGKPSRRGIAFERVLKAGELILTIHSLIVGEEFVSTLSGLPGEFLTQDLKWELLSIAKGSGGMITARYRRK